VFVRAIHIVSSASFLNFSMYILTIIIIFANFKRIPTNQHCVLIAVEASNPLHYEALPNAPYITGEYTDLLTYYTYSENAEVIDKSRPYFTFYLKYALKGSLNNTFSYNPEKGPYRGASVTEKVAESQPFSSTEEADNRLVAAIDNNQARDYLIKYLTEKKSLLTVAQHCVINSGLSLLFVFKFIVYI
jgi:hypothetical protein